MAGVLTFSQYIGGPDQLIMEQTFPSNQQSVIYKYGTVTGGIAAWTFTADYQTVVVDTVTFNRYTGAPNFANSLVLGTFPSVVLTGTDLPSIINSVDATAFVNFPKEMYAGPIIPDARKNVPIVVFGYQWTIPSAGAPDQIETHRWGLMQAWEPGVSPNDPTTYAGYTELTV